MDFTRNVVLKEDYSFLAAAADGRVAGGEHGLYHRDTRFLSRYDWRFDPQLQLLLLHSARPDGFVARHARLAHHGQTLALRRDCTISGAGLSDRLTLEATGEEEQEVQLELGLAADFADLFEVHGWSGLERAVKAERWPLGARFTYEDAQGAELVTEVTFSQGASWTAAGSARFQLSLNPGARGQIAVDVTVTGGEATVPAAEDYSRWRSRFEGLQVPAGLERVVQRSIDDLRALLLFTPDGPVPAAGIPWYVAPFGRDALLTAAMLLPFVPQVARATLRFLARHQAAATDPVTRAQPGKIMHELRQGELTRLGLMPHRPYYGTVDATPLFVVLLHRYWRATGDLELVRELQPNWEAALAWMVDAGDLDGDGFLEFTPDSSPGGLGVQSWKDSPDSMSHADGSLAGGDLAVSEVQGYAYDAYAAAGRFYRQLGENPTAARWEERADGLRRDFLTAFWLEDLGTYALALDGAKRPLRVRSSDAGHLLWSGLVPEEHAARLVGSLMGPELWSGWGFRTLGSTEKRYDPVSYHNGSVWPHDSALVAIGLARYGFRAEAAQVARALLDLALTQGDLRLPELVAGYGREADGLAPVPPVPYPVACRPQAWDAAAVICLLNLL